MKTKVVRLVNRLTRGQIGTECRRQHEPFAQERRTFDEDRAEDHRQKEKISQSFKTPAVGWFGELLANLDRRPKIVAPVDDVEDGQQHGNSHPPHWPAMFGHPPERDALQIAEEQRRITNRCQASAHV